VSTRAGKAHWVSLDQVEMAEGIRFTREQLIAARIPVPPAEEVS